jgi:hypothetical protein
MKLFDASAAFALGTSLLLASAVHADGIKRECAESYDRVQDLIDKQQLIAAKHDALKCAAADCSVTQPDCLRWLSDLSELMPSITLVVALDGKELELAHVEVDNKPLGEKVPAYPIQLDPGAHNVLIRVGDLPAQNIDVTLRQGEKAKVIRVQFKSPEQPAPPIIVRPIPTATWVLGGVSVASFVGAAFFGAVALTNKNFLQGTCSPGCSNTSVGALEARYGLADAALILGALAAGGALTFYFTRPSRVEQPTGPVASLTPAGLGAVFNVKF